MPNRVKKWTVERCKNDHTEQRMLKPHVIVRGDGYPAGIFDTFTEAWAYLREQEHAA